MDVHQSRHTSAFCGNAFGVMRRRNSYAVRETQGWASAVSEDAMLDGMLDLAREAGCFACPEGGATLAALRLARASNQVRDGERVVIFNTGSGLKYPEAWRAALARAVA